MALGLLRFMFVLILVIGTIPRKSCGQSGKWCIANEKTPNEQLQKGLDWACGNGANCTNIQVNQPCFLPNTVKDHASYAFNNYYQNMKHKGGNCEFNGAAILTASDPSHGTCKFEVVP